MVDIVMKITTKTNNYMKEALKTCDMTGRTYKRSLASRFTVYH